MNEKQYGILYVLNRFINDTSDSIDSILAKYFIQNYYDAKSRALVKEYKDMIHYRF